MTGTEWLVQATYESAEAVGNLTVFNIKGNRYRLIVDIIYSNQRIYLKYVLTADAFASRHLQSRCAGTYVPPKERAPRRINGKMTLTINLSDYAQLLAKYQPKVIETEAESDRAIELARELEHKANRSNEEDAIARSGIHGK